MTRALFGIATGAVLLAFVAVDFLYPEPKVDGGMELACATSKPSAWAWIDAQAPLPVELLVELDFDGDGKADATWRAEGGGKLGLYWTVAPGVLYRATWTVAGVSFPPSKWGACTAGAR